MSAEIKQIARESLTLPTEGPISPSSPVAGSSSDLARSFQMIGGHYNTGSQNSYGVLGGVAAHVATLNRTSGQYTLRRSLSSSYASRVNSRLNSFPLWVLTPPPPIGAVNKADLSNYMLF